MDEKGVSLKMKAFKDMSFEELKQYREIKKHPMPWLWRMLYLHHGGYIGIESFGARYYWSQAIIDKAVNFMKNSYGN